MIDNYYKMLVDSKSFDDIKKIIVLVNSDINYYLKIGRNDKLLELKKLLHLLEVVSLYVIKRKFDEVLPMLQEIRIDMLKDNKSKYLRMYEKILEIDVMGNSINKNMSLDELNRWISKLFKLYSEYGYNVSEDDFKNLFDSNISNYKKNNTILYEYMSLLLKLLDGDFDKDVDNDKMVSKVFEFGNRGLLPDDITDEIPGFDIIRLGISKFNDMHEDIIYKEINELSLEVGFGKIDSKKLASCKDKINKNILMIDKKLKQIEDGDISYILPEYEDMFISVKDIEDDIKIYQLCDMVSNGKYSKMSVNERDSFFKDLPIIMDLIVKYRLFLTFSDEYDKYATLNDYDEIKTEIDCYEKKIIKLREDIDIQKQYCDALLSKKTGIRYPLKKKDVDTKKAYDKLNEMKYLLEEMSYKLKDFYKQKSEYILGFNNKFNDYDFKKIYHIDGMNSMDKIFGVFDFDMLPITNNNINDMEVLRKYNIELPDDESMEFVNLSKLCLGLINSPLLRNRIDSNTRIRVDIEDKYLECLHDGLFDKHVDTVLFDAKDEVTIHNKKR